MSKKSTPKPAPIIKLSGVTSQTLPFADSTSFSWVVTNANSVTLNNKSVQAHATCKTGRLLADTTFDLVATGDGGTADISFTISVGDWKTSNYGVISHKPWTFDSLAVSFVSDTSGFYTYKPDEVDPSFIGEKYTFAPNGDYTDVLASGKVVLSGKWSLSGDSLSYGLKAGVKWSKIIKLSDSLLIFVQEAPSDIGKSWIRLTYKR